VSVVAIGYVVHLYAALRHPNSHVNPAARQARPGRSGWDHDDVTGLVSTADRAWAGGPAVTAPTLARWRPASSHVTNKPGTGHDAIDTWLLERYQLHPLERSQVRRAVFQGRQVTDPA